MKTNTHRCDGCSLKSNEFFGRGCIDKILRKNISPKIKCKVWIL
jgi:hypothetical protein